MYKAICTASQTPVIIKAYDKSKMKPKNLARVEREICLMQQLGGGSGVVELYCVFEDSAHRYLVCCCVFTPLTILQIAIVQRASQISCLKQQPMQSCTACACCRSMCGGQTMFQH